tara:strand:- start:9845 stop:10240 length:396 start_codon:yes stop_codon:yes gene_type:complete
MSSGLSAALPLTLSEVFGAYNLNTTFFELAKQNLKMLILTMPGEKIMDPFFGVGLKRYLFEMNDQGTYDRITERIMQQTKIYLPYIKIDNIDYGITENNPDLYPHNLAVRIDFEITPLQLLSTLQINVVSN